MIVLGDPNSTQEVDATMTFAQYYARTAALLSDEALAQELRCARQSAMRCTRTRRELALLRIRCLDCELANRHRSATSKAGGITQGENSVRALPASG